jgi:ElaB/YqjD/DUF883 family membrane-anchored ribosome-binding protein
MDTHAEKIKEHAKAIAEEIGSLVREKTPDTGEVGEHLKAAARETLLAARTALDKAIEKLGPK